MHQIYQYVRISHILIIKIKKGTFPHIFTHITIDSESNKCSNVPCSLLILVWNEQTSFYLRWIHSKPHTEPLVGHFRPVNFNMGTRLCATSQKCVETEAGVNMNVRVCFHQRWLYFHSIELGFTIIRAFSSKSLSGSVTWLSTNPKCN